MSKLNDHRIDKIYEALKLFYFESSYLKALESRSEIFYLRDLDGFFRLLETKNAKFIQKAFRIQSLPNSTIMGLHICIFFFRFIRWSSHRP